MAKHWSTVAERGSLLGMKILFWVYRLLGRRVLWVFLFPVVLYFFLTGKSMRSASRQFLEQVHRNKETTGEQANITWFDSLKHFCSFADAAFDKLDAWLGQIAISNIDYHPAGVMEKIDKQKRGAVFIGSHLGNLEVCRALSQGRYNTPINVLVFTENAIKFNQILQQVNPNVSVNLIQLTNIGPELAINLKEKVDQGEIVVIVGDRTSVSVAGRVIYAPFLGTPAPFSQGPFILAALLACPVYWLFCLKDKSRYQVIFEHVSDEISLPRKQREQVLTSLVEQYAQRLSDYAAKYPLQWFNFYDFWQQDASSERKQSMEKNVSE